MNRTTKILSIAATAALSIAGCAATSPPSGAAAKFAAQEKTYQAESAAMPQMTAAQTAQYRAEYQAAKAKWAAMTPVEEASMVASARQKKIAELTAMERVGQNDDTYLLPW
jgi:protein-disulfide isomerase